MATLTPRRPVKRDRTTIVARAVQVEEWLADLFPTDHLVVVRWINGTGDTPADWHFDTRGRHVIRLTRKGCRTKPETNELLLHEYAHALHFDARKRRGQDPHGGDDHGDEFWMIFGRLWVAFQETGWREAYNY